MFCTAITNRYDLEILDTMIYRYLTNIGRSVVGFVVDIS